MEDVVDEGTDEQGLSENQFEQEAADEEVEVAMQLCHEDLADPGNIPDPLMSEAGRQYYELWANKVIDGGAVAWRWGQGVLQRFQQMKGPEKQEGTADEEFEEQKMIAAVMMAEANENTERADTEEAVTRDDGAEASNVEGMPMDVLEAAVLEEENLEGRVVDVVRSMAEGKGEGV